MGSSTVQGTHPLGLLFPNFHQGDCSGGCNSISCRDRGGRPSSSSFSGLLQPDVRCLEDLRVVVTSDRPFGLHSLSFKVSLQEGDHSVGSFVSSSGRLAGLHRSQGSILASPRPPGQSQVLYLRFVAFGEPCQFWALCLGLSLVPQVFTRVMTPISSILHSLGIRMRRYLDDWLIPASSRETFLQALSTVLSLCRELGVVVNPE